MPQPKAKAGAVKSRDLHPRPSRFRLQLRLLQRFVVAQGEGGFDAFLSDGEGADWQWPERAKYPEADARRRLCYEVKGVVVSAALPGGPGLVHLGKGWVGKVK